MSKNKPFVFPKWVNFIPLVLPVLLIGGIATAVFVIWYWCSPKHIDVGYQPKQPIAYSHELHAGELGIDCRYCHTNVEKGAKATIPSTDICMNCHKAIKTQSPEIKKLQQSWQNNQPVQWVRVNALPDYVYFDHSRHVNSGVGCATCHGRVDKMKQVHQVQPLSMAWCVECHKTPEKFLRPQDKITDMTWVAPNQTQLGMKLKKDHYINTSLDCSVCHR